MPASAPSSASTTLVTAPLVGSGVLLLGAAVGVSGVWAAALWLSAHVRADETLHSVALFVHLSALVVGFGAVLALSLNGVQAFSLHASLQAAAGPLPRPLLLRAAATATVSQAGWWTATVIGFLTHQAG